MVTFNAGRRLQRLQLHLPAAAEGLASAGHRLGRSYRAGLMIIGGLTIWWLGWLLYRWLADPGWLAVLPEVLLELLLLAETAGGFTLAFLWGGLGLHYWRRSRRIILGGLPPISREKLYKMSPKAFERYVAELFRQKGYRVAVRGRSGDLGVDLEVADKQERRAIVQCKRYRATVGAEVVRELYGTLIHEQVAHAFLVTTADISEAAREWALGKPMTLIDGRMLVEIAASLRSRPA